MKNLLPKSLCGILLLFPFFSFGQAPTLGTTQDFVLFSSNGALSNTGVSHLTGNVGTNSGSSTGFGNVNGGMHDNDLVSAQAAADLLLLYAELNSTIPTDFPGLLLGNGDTLQAGVFSIPAAATLNLDLILDAEGDQNAIFIFQIDGSFSVNSNSKIKLINGAQACNVFWSVDGLIDVSSGSFMRGTLLANNAAILLNVGDTLEGRALSINGAITINGVFAYTPIGCGSPILLGPSAPALLSTECYAVFSGDGPVINSGVTYVTGDVGTNVGLTTGFNSLYVAGMIHSIPDGSTATAAADLLNVYSYLNTLPYDIELLYPAQFGNNLVLTPHTYVMNGGVTFTDTLYLNAEGEGNAIFVIQINGALTTSTNSKVILINGTQSKNVYWKVDGAVEINDYSVFRGTLVANNAAIDLKTGVIIDGRAMTTNGALTTTAVQVTMPIGCSANYAPVIVNEPSNDSACIGQIASFTVVATGTGLSYQWRQGATNLIDGGSISGSTTNVLTINPVSGSDYATNYNVVVSGTVAPDDISVNVSLLTCLVGINSFESEMNATKAKMYPNPFTNVLNISLTDDVQFEQTRLVIYNTLGVEVINATLKSQFETINTNTLKPGVYYYRLIENNVILQIGKLIAQ